MAEPLDYAPPAARFPLARFAPAISIALLVLAALYFAWRGPMSMAGKRLWDYAVCASSSQVWLRGGDPYNAGVVNDNWQRQHVGLGIEEQIVWLRPIVPPTTLVVLAPFAAMRSDVGAYLYMALTVELVVVAAWCSALWAGLHGRTAWRFYAAGILLSVPATLGLYSGNPVMLAGPLILIGLFLSARQDRHWVGGLLVGVGTACKIQVGIPLMLIWLIVGRAKPVVVAASTLCILALIGGGRLSLAGVDWWHGWTRNVAEANGPGGLNDYATTYNRDDHLNLQVPLWAETDSRGLTEATTLLLVAGPAAVFGAMLLRSRGRLEERGKLFAVCVAATLLVLPVYHRTYDGIILLPAFAAFLVSTQSSDRTTRWLGIVGLVLLASMLPPAGLMSFLERRGYVPPRILVNEVYNVFVVTYRPWAILGSSVPLIWLLARARRSENQSMGADSEKKSVANIPATLTSVDG